MIQKGRRIWAARAYGTELGCALADDKAGEIVRKMGEVASIQSLVIRSTVLSPKSVARYEGVCYRKPGKSQGGWWVGKKHFFKDFRAAIAHICRMRGVTQEKLRKRVAPSELAARLRTATSIVDPMPDDLKDLVARAPLAKRMFRVAPVMVPLFLQAKMGPWRGLIQKAWNAIAPPSSVHCPLDTVAEATLAWQVLRRVASDMVKDRQLRVELEWWNKLNSGVQHHSGFLPMCVALGILETGGTLDLGSVETKYKLSTNKTAAVDKLKAMSLAWSSLSSVLCTPRTCKAWRNCMSKALALLRRKGAPRLNPNVGMYTTTLDLALLPHHGHQGGGDHQDDMGEHWHPGVGADGPRPKEVVSSLGAACQDVACIEKAAWGALPTRVAQLPALSLVPEKLG